MLSRQVFGAGEIIAIPLPLLDRWAANTAALKAPRRKTPCRSRALLVDCSTCCQPMVGIPGVHEGNLSIKQDKKCGEPAGGPRACSKEALRIDMSPNGAIRDYLSGSRARMDSFETVWWISCCRFKCCAMVPDSSCPEQAGERLGRPGPPRAPLSSRRVRILRQPRMRGVSAIIRDADRFSSLATASRQFK